MRETELLIKFNLIEIRNCDDQTLKITKLSSEDKQQVINDWHKAFPELAIYSRNKLYKSVGSIVIGLELIKLPHSSEYRPHFVVYPLWQEDLKASLNRPVILQEFKTKKGSQFSIPYEKHLNYFNEARESVEQQTPLPLSGDISVEVVFSAIDDYAQVPPLSASMNSYWQGILQETKLKIALYADPEKAHTIFDRIVEIKWDANHFQLCGVNVSEWIQGLKEVIDCPSDFLEQIEMNKKDGKFKC